LLVRTPRPQSFHGSEGKERGVPLGPPAKELDARKHAVP
jgi:hypothetical protein